MKEYIEISVARPESDLAGYSSVRINPVACYRIDTTLEKFVSAIQVFQEETGLQVHSVQRFFVAEISEFGETMKLDKMVRYIADTMPPSSD